MSLQRHFSHQQANRENSESFLFLYQCTCLKSFLRIQKCYWIYKSNCKAQSHTYCSASLCSLPEVWTKSLLCNILICAACQKSRNKQKEKSIRLYQVSKAGIQNEIVAKGKYAVIKQLNSEKLCCSISLVLKYCRKDDLKVKEIQFWVAVEKYLCSAIIASWYQSSLVVGAPRKTCDLCCVSHQSSKRLCYGQRTFWSALWKK